MMKLKEDYQQQKEADREQMSKELEDFKASYVSSQDQDSTKRMYLLHDYTDDSQAANGSIIDDTLTDELDQSINSSQKKKKRQGQKKRKQYLDNSMSEQYAAKGSEQGKLTHLDSVGSLDPKQQASRHSR
jgi:hypothetical protein